MEILHQLDNLASFIWKHVLFVAAIVLVYEGTRGLVSKENRRNSLAILFTGVLLMTCMASLSLWISHTMDGINKNFSTPSHGELSTNWGAHQTPEERERNSRLYASMSFTHSGKTVKYFNQANGWQRYCPTDIDLAQREEAISLKHQTQQLADDAYSVALQWVAYGMVAAGLGVFAGRRRTKCSG